ncbi:A disintegrin and metalloproteinase with thrombospondin motifs 6 [Plakobranchus ocellatus]|uniref:A disintegrin and metalloproteinase with thrombospondin motifs 6 n=1 Tax=Plakobranchus ocellatus TaxID=259542 RepID=A0AAV4BTZ3_9GAST|nr:A disintegrin and metalloproteinase with thrombospondin motifs 6 [Plakobranchus ocellatus]
MSNLLQRRWSVGQWSGCSKTCGTGGLRTRRVVCLQHVSERDPRDSDARLLLDDAECQGQRPATERECRLKDCPAEWHTFEWTKSMNLLHQCVPSCGPGERRRRVFCMTSDARHYLEERRCRTQDKPVTRQACRNRDCPPPKWRHGEWSQVQPLYLTPCLRSTGLDLTSV